MNWFAFLAATLALWIAFICGYGYGRLRRLKPGGPQGLLIGGNTVVASTRSFEPARTPAESLARRLVVNCGKPSQTLNLLLDVLRLRGDVTPAALAEALDRDINGGP